MDCRYDGIQEMIPQSSLPERFAGARFFSTAIHYLLAGGDFSAFHRIRSDEVWHYYDGGSDLLIHVIYPDGTYKWSGYKKSCLTDDKCHVCLTVGGIP